MLFKYFLIIYLLTFVAVAIVWRTYTVWKRTGQSAYALLNNSGVHGIIEKYFRIIPFLSLFTIMIYVFFEQYYEYLSPIIWVSNYLIFQIIGIILLLLSLLWIVVAQVQMGNSWRIGIDKKNKTELITHGVFQHSRNPIFFGIIVNVIGFFLILPNAITLLIMILDIILIQIQVSLEEEHLENLHGEKYIQYCQKVRRWF